MAQSLAAAHLGVEVKSAADARRDMWSQDNGASAMMAPAVFAMLLLAVAVFQLMCKHHLMHITILHACVFLCVRKHADLSEGQTPHVTCLLIGHN